MTPGSSFGEAWRRRLDAAPHQAAATAFRVSAGEALVVVVAHPDDETLAMGAALARLASDGVRVHVLAESRGEAVRDVVESAVRAHGAAQVATLWRGDPRPDHHAVSMATARAAARTGAGLVELGLWASHWTDPTGVATVVPVRRDPVSQRAKRAAIACYRSQTEPLAAGLEAVLPPAVLSFPHEYVVRP